MITIPNYEQAKVSVQSGLFNPVDKIVCDIHEGGSITPNLTMHSLIKAIEFVFQAGVDWHMVPAKKTERPNTNSTYWQKDSLFWNVPKSERLNNLVKWYCYHYAGVNYYSLKLIDIDAEFLERIRVIRGMGETTMNELKELLIKAGIEL